MVVCARAAEVRRLRGTYEQEAEITIAQEVINKKDQHEAGAPANERDTTRALDPLELVEECRCRLHN